MEGKTIEKVLELGDSVVLLKMDDGTFVSAKIIDPEIPADIVNEFFEETELSSASKEKKPEKKELKESPEADDNLDWDQINEMNLKTLKKLIDDKTLITDADDFTDDLPGLKVAIAKELEIEVPIKEKGGKEDVPESSDYIWQDLVDMDYDELATLCKDNQLDTKSSDFEQDKEEDDFRRVIAAECGIDAPPKKKKLK